MAGDEPMRDLRAVSFGKLLLHRVELGAVLQIHGTGAAGLGTASAVESRKIRQTGEVEMVVTRRFGARERQVVALRLQIASRLGFVPIVIAECRKPEHAPKDA